MSWPSLASAILGGGLIGIAASLLLLLKGRIFGVSGILAGVLFPSRGDFAWKVGAILGLIASGFLFMAIQPEMLVGSVDGSWTRYLLAGLLVGFGTTLGSGCTSGHGVCGISRMSPRSFVATVTFILSGIMIVAIIRSAGGTP